MRTARVAISADRRPAPGRSGRGRAGSRLRLGAALAALFAALLLTGCSSFGLLYERLDLVARLQLRRFVTLDDTQKADYNARFRDLWNWHRRTQLPLYARDLRAIAARDAAPTAESVAADAEMIQAHVATTSGEIARRLAPVVASLRDEQVGQIRKEMERRAAKLDRKRARQSQDDWADDRADEMIDRWDDYLGSVNPRQKQLIHDWAAQIPKPPPDVRAPQRAAFLALLARRGDAAFAPEFEHYMVAPFDVELAAEPEDPQRQRTIALTVALGAAADDEQRAYFRRKLLDTAADFERMAAEAPR